MRNSEGGFRGGTGKLPGSYRGVTGELPGSNREAAGEIPGSYRDGTGEAREGEIAMIPTKEQERKALEQIKSILAGLSDDPDTSYLLRAFEGCVEDAEANIENDFGNSWKRRAESAEKRIKELEEKVKATETEMECAKLKIEEQLERETISPEDMRKIQSIIIRDGQAQADIMAEQREIVLAACTNPESEKFKKAAEKYTVAKRRHEATHQMHELLERMRWGK